MGDELDGNPDEAEIRAFHAAARRRQVRIMFIAAGVMIALGIVLVALTFIIGPATPKDGISYRARSDVGMGKLWIYGALAIAAGIGAAWNGWRIHKGERYG